MPDRARLNLAGVWIEVAGDHPKQSRFAGPVRAEYEVESIGGCVEGDVRNDRRGTESLREVDDAQTWTALIFWLHSRAGFDHQAPLSSTVGPCQRVALPNGV